MKVTVKHKFGKKVFKNIVNVKCESGWLIMTKKNGKQVNYILNTIESFEIK